MVAHGAEKAQAAEKGTATPERREGEGCAGDLAAREASHGAAREVMEEHRPWQQQ